MTEGSIELKSDSPNEVRRTLLAGGSVTDVQAGSAAGAGWVVGVTSGGVSAEVLRAAPHTHVVSPAAEIPFLLGLP